MAEGPFRLLLSLIGPHYPALQLHILLEWIRELEDKTQGKRLAIEDIKTVVARTLGTAAMITLIQAAGGGYLDGGGPTTG